MLDHCVVFKTTRDMQNLYTKYLLFIMKMNIYDVYNDNIYVS